MPKQTRKQWILERMKQLEDRSSELTKENLRKETTQTDVARIEAMHTEWEELAKELKKL